VSQIDSINNEVLLCKEKNAETCLIKTQDIEFVLQELARLYRENQTLHALNAANRAESLKAVIQELNVVKTNIEELIKNKTTERSAVKAALMWKFP
jgi:hypothetical protein